MNDKDRLTHNSAGSPNAVAAKVQPEDVNTVISLAERNLKSI